MSTTSALAPDTTIALGIASAAIPFARTPQAGAECWLRILRLYGESGIVLQALGVGEETIEAPGRDMQDGTSAAEDSYEPDALIQVVDEAVRLAGEEGAAGITTTNLLLAVMNVYGEDFDRALRAHGTTSQDLSRRVGGTV